MVAYLIQNKEYKTKNAIIYVEAFISRHVQMIQNDLLYNKIECYKYSSTKED